MKYEEKRRNNRRDAIRNKPSIGQLSEAIDVNIIPSIRVGDDYVVRVADIYTLAKRIHGDPDGWRNRETLEMGRSA
jgi:hypothetical protein